MRRVAKFAVRPIVIGPLLVVLSFASIGFVALRGGKPLPETASVTRAPFGEDVARLIDGPPMTPAPSPSPTPTRHPKPKPAKHPAGPNLSAFRGLGSWVDLYDYAKLNPETSVADMRARGVKTLYIQTARWNKPAKEATESFADVAILDRWLDAAHAQRMKVVGWYLPAYDDLTRDVRRTRDIALHRTGAGQTFDGLGIDVEYRAQAESLPAWNAGVAEHARRVRAALGSRYPIAAIVPTPLQMEIRPTYWAGFPWRALGGYADVFMPMAYWSFRDDCASNPQHCAYGYTKGSVEQVRALTGKPRVPVHVIGGVGDSIATAEVHDFVSAAASAGVYGGSLYDYLTTKPDYWAPLAKLNG